MQRYKRQIALPEIGVVGQERLKQARVLVIGAGALGSPILLYLVAAGVGTIGIVDSDIVETSNLHRQILYDEDQINIAKVTAAKNRLMKLNAEVDLRIFNEKLSENNALSILKDYHVVIDATDNFSAKYLINACATFLKIPAIYGAIFGFEGRVIVLDGEEGACYNCLYPVQPIAHIPNCAELGVIGALAGIVGSVQALETIKIILNQSILKSLSGQLWLIDGRTLQTQKFQIKKKIDCAVCACPEKIELKLFKTPAVMCGSYSVVNTVSPEQARALSEAIFIDVRELHEWQEGYIEHAIHLPLSHLYNETSLSLKNLDRLRKYVIYCRSGIRSHTVAKMFLEQGFKYIWSLAGGIEAWTEQKNYDKK